MELNEMEKRMLYQTEGSERYAVLHELAMASRYAGNPDRGKAADSLIGKLNSLPDSGCREIVHDIRRNYRLPKGARTVGEMMAEARQRTGAEQLKGHDIMALERFDPEVRHMVIFEVVSGDSFAGDKGDRVRLFLTDAGLEVLNPINNLKTLVLAIIGAVGVIILAKNVMEFAQAYQQQDSSSMNSALKGIVAGLIMAGISAVMSFLGF